MYLFGVVLVWSCDNIERILEYSRGVHVSLGGRIGDLFSFAVLIVDRFPSTLGEIVDCCAVFEEFAFREFSLNIHR